MISLHVVTNCVKKLQFVTRNCSGDQNPVQLSATSRVVSCLTITTNLDLLGPRDLIDHVSTGLEYVVRICGLLWMVNGHGPLWYNNKIRIL